jgi:hypothetical protein
MASTRIDVYGDSTLMTYAEIFAELPQELRLPIARLRIAELQWWRGNAAITSSSSTETGTLGV